MYIQSYHKQQQNNAERYSEKKCKASRKTSLWSISLEQLQSFSLQFFLKRTPARIFVMQFQEMFYDRYSVKYLFGKLFVNSEEILS